MRRRAEALLARVIAGPQSPRTIQALRAIEVLERIGSQKARELLQKVAAGAPDARLTCEARAALERLARGPDSTP